MQDYYLDPKKTTLLTDEATNEIEVLYPDITESYFKQRLIDLTVYMKICIDEQSDTDDIYTTKYKQYEKLLEKTLSQAINNLAKTTNNGIFSVEIGRG